MNEDEIRKQKEDELNFEDFEFVMDDPYLAKSQRIRDILDALDLVDPVNKKVENIIPMGDVPGQEVVNIEYFTIYTPTIDKDDRKRLIAKLMSLLLEDDDTVQ